MRDRETRDGIIQLTVRMRDVIMILHKRRWHPDDLPKINTTTALVIARSKATKQSRFTAANCQPEMSFFALFGRYSETWRKFLPPGMTPLAMEDSMTFQRKYGCNIKEHEERASL